MTSAPKRFQKVYIEISNVCNLQCTFCPEVERDKRFMDPALFETVTRAVAPLTQSVCFHLMGEPLLHPHFADYVTVCEGLRLPLQLTTNGLLLNPERTRAMLNPTVQQVNFSVQSVESNFPGENHSAYFERLLAFVTQAMAERPDLYINFRLWNEGAPEAEAFNESLFVHLRRHFGMDIQNTADVRWKKRIPLKGRVSLHMDSRFEWPNPHHPVRSTQGFCHGLSSHIGILADGTVVPCCLDKEGVINLGNCARLPLSTILESPRATAIKNGFAQGTLVEDLCQKCTFIARFDQKLARRGPGSKTASAS